MHFITLHHCSYLIFTYILHSCCPPSPLTTPSVFSSLLSFLLCYVSVSNMFLSFSLPPFFHFLPTSQHHTSLPPSHFSLSVLLIRCAHVTPPSCLFVAPPWSPPPTLVPVLLNSNFDLLSLSWFLYLFLPSLVSFFCSYPVTVFSSPLFFPSPLSSFISSCCPSFSSFKHFFLHLMNLFLLLSFRCSLPLVSFFICCPSLSSLFSFFPLNFNFWSSCPLVSHLLLGCPYFLIFS